MPVLWNGSQKKSVPFFCKNLVQSWGSPVSIVCSVLFHYSQYQRVVFCYIHLRWLFEQFLSEKNVKKKNRIVSDALVWNGMFQVPHQVYICALRFILYSLLLCYCQHTKTVSLIINWIRPHINLIMKNGIFIMYYRFFPPIFHL